jgi:hypothetical protein
MEEQASSISPYSRSKNASQNPASQNLASRMFIQLSCIGSRSGVARVGGAREWRAWWSERLGCGAVTGQVGLAIFGP